jgi:hypothetical protein
MNSKLLLLLVGLSTSLSMISPLVLANDDAPKVAVLVEKGLVPVGGTPALPPSRIVGVLRQYGIEAEPLSAAELSDYAVLNTRRYAVLVMAYGNGFPKSALKTIRAYHAAGGCLVMNGVPFCHPCDKVNGTWTDLGHVSYFGHDANGTGTGGFGGPLPKEKNPIATIPGRPLGLTEDMLPSSDGSLQWLDPRSFPPEDEVIPLVNIGIGNEQHPAAAVIRHHCASFHGACDVWIGQVAQETDDLNRYFAEQLVVRGVLWCLLEKQQITKSTFAEELKALDAVQKPKPFPENLPYSVTPRPWGDSFLPKSSPPARHLQVVDVAPLKPDERIALACLQGLTSRKQPVLWLRLNDNDQFWLDYHKEKKYIASYETVPNWTGLFRQYSNSYKGAIVPDTNLFRGDLLAVNVAACEDLIVTTPELANKLGIPVKIDLRGRFKTYTEGMRWVWTTYKDRLSHHLCRYAHPSLLQECNFSYDMQWRGVDFWIVGPLDEDEPGADKLAECRLMAEIFSEMDPNTAMLGFPAIPAWGFGYGLGEPDGVKFASRYAKGVVGSDYLRNICVMSGVRLDHLENPHQPPPPTLDRNSIYIALALSDGDNENAWLDFFTKYFQDSSFGKFPLAFGIGPPIREIMPAVAQWYYEHASPQTEFIAEVSGIAYIRPEFYGSAYADRDHVYAGFLDWTAHSMQAMGLRTVRTERGGDYILTRYAQALPFCHSVFADMARDSDRWGIDHLTYSLPGGMPVFRAVTGAGSPTNKTGFLHEIREQVGTQRPAFVHGWVNCWVYDPDDLARIYEQRDPDMVFVTPAQLATLYRQAEEKGWVK